mmetsp:Transcript_11274/g.17119  ORF Transcript_11274/g.17119 Transcript_11274/m.17119 type:complete len:470 (-) Transcript_11274:93-1502(-)|eukprot:CAMPEP_0202700632 /NCGR_PEP_ID=MMETSP1385-20130828/13809_1 /ASSEMBLY_ACC=CAM_ASM_000861 /TAXON_ID=933848 /ORGANISM="Elphidium margaritaceum" /LENGTH=469 /DNA_ID=CAMNT_0049357861 /DNA_START=21 /DNA_END=1430 /DNA_ORIENTATION=+
MAHAQRFPAQQQTLIENFRAITNYHDEERIVAALQQCNWDLNACVTLFFEDPDALMTGTNANGGPQPSEPTQPNRSQSSVSTSEHQQQDIQSTSTLSSYANYIPGLSFLTSLIGSMLSLFSPMLPYFASIFSGFGAASPHSVAYREILREFHRENSIFSRLDNASIFSAVRFGELMNSDKCLFLLFKDDNSTSSTRFIRNVLCDECVVDYLRANLACWIGDGRNAEGRDLFRQITHHWNEKRKPFVCIAGVHPITRKLVLVHRQYVGNITSSTVFIANILDHGLQRWQTFKLQQLQRQQLSQSNRDLREMQDREYLLQEQQALQQQQPLPVSSSAQLQSPCPQQQQQQQSSPQQRREDKHQTRMKNAQDAIRKIDASIENAMQQDLVTVALRLPNGSRVQRVFCNDNAIESLFDFAMCHELKVDGEFIDEFELVCNYPKQIFSKQDCQRSLRDVGLESNTLLFVQETSI